MAKSRNMRLKAITSALLDNFHDMLLKFIETDEANNRYPVDFKFKEVVFFSDERAVFKGSINVSEQDWADGYIEYVNKATTKLPGHFYRVKYYANGKIKRMYQLKPFPHPRYTKDIEDIMAFMGDYDYSEKDDESDVDKNGDSLNNPR